MSNQFKPYKVDKFASIPSWIKILVLKFWAAGAAYYFIAMGSGFIGINNDFGFIMMLALLLTLIFDYLVKQIIRLMRNSKDDTFRFNMVNFPGVKGLLLQLLYMLIITEPVLIIGAIFVTNGLWFNLLQNDNFKGLDPFLFGLVFVFVDAIFVLAKYYINKYIQNKKNKQLEIDN